MSAPTLSIAIPLLTWCLPLLPCLAAQEVVPATKDSVLLKAARTELERSLAKLKDAGEASVYYLAYRIYELETIGVSAANGALGDQSQSGKERVLDVELRVGSHELDSTHRLRDQGFDFSSFDFDGLGWAAMPIDDDEAAIRAALWAATDKQFKAAQKQFTKVKANKAVKVEEEDPSADFSREAPVTWRGEPTPLQIDKKDWQARLRRASARYLGFPEVHDSSFTLSGQRVRRVLVTSEGTSIEDEATYYRLSTMARTVAEDGMSLWLFDSVEAQTPATLPDAERLSAMAGEIAQSLVALRRAPVAEPYAGPAILRGRAAGVFFHEIFGHRIEGHRQKDEEEGRTFAKKIGQQVMPDFLTIVDDPGRRELGGLPLNGFYRYDDEGIAGARTLLVDQGVLRTFLLGRSPVQGFASSNGHGRAEPGQTPVARMGNLIVEAAKTVSYEALRAQLLDEARRQGKPYGLIFDEIAGGFTSTQTFMPQAFKLLPLRVWRVWADGKPDELLRGVDLVGTPLTSIEKVLAASDTVGVFNGTCGAESGWVPVSACAPDLLVQTIEVERRQKEQDKPPILPPPGHDPQETPDPPKASPAKDK